MACLFIAVLSPLAVTNGNRRKNQPHRERRRSQARDGEAVYEIYQSKERAIDFPARETVIGRVLFDFGILRSVIE